MIGLQEAQEASAHFFGPVTLAYVVVCATWWCVDRRWCLWSKPDVPTSPRPWTDLVLAFVAFAGVIGVGQLYQRGMLLDGRSSLNGQLNHLLVWAPFFFVVALRRAPTMTFLVARERLWLKALTGTALGALGAVVFCGVRGEWGRLGEVASGVTAWENLRFFFPVFMEGVAVAYLYVRLRGVAGPVWSLLVPCLLFAVGHVPRQLAGGRELGEIVAFFGLNTLLPMMIFLTVIRSRDVVWIGFAHYVMDIAIRAFE